jgi:valyl-tRNA synthetase
MSKSAGNGVDPIEMIDKFGADALRFNIITGNSPGNDMRFYVERCEAMRNFANKLWNASRFVMMNLTVRTAPCRRSWSLRTSGCSQSSTTSDARCRENLDKL